MTDTTPEQAVTPPPVDPGGAVLSFHVGDVRQFVTEVGAALRLRVPAPRPAFGVDDEGNPRPDPRLAPPEPEAKAARAAPEKPTEKAPERPEARR